MNRGKKVSDFDYEKLRKEAQTRWLRPPEILYILQNHEKYHITERAPQKPPSGSLFLVNRRVLRFYRNDGHMWRKKKDGRAVGEAHEKLKVRNVEALNCYYAHGEPNPYFQRRSYWILDPAYDHIVLVHYREVSEGRFLSGLISNSNMSADSCSTFNQGTGVSSVHYQGITSGTTELHEANGYSCSSGSLEEVSSKFFTEKIETDHLSRTDGSGNSELSPQPEVNQALRKLAEQLSLDDDDITIYFGEKLPAYCTEYETSQDLGLQDYETMQPLQEPPGNILHGLEYWEHNQVESGKQFGHSSFELLNIPGDNGKGSQSLDLGHSIEGEQYPWNGTLELSSSSAAIKAHESTSGLFVPKGVSVSAGATTSAFGAHFPSRSMLQHDGLLSSAEKEEISVIPFEKSEQITWQQLNQGGNSAESRQQYQVPESDLGLQLSQAKSFLLGPHSHIDLPTSVSHIPEVETQRSSGTTCEANCNVVQLRKENSSYWMGTPDLTVSNNTDFSEFPGMWLHQGQYGIPLIDSNMPTEAPKEQFIIRDISPEWAFSFESTKIIITGEFLCDPSECPWSIMFGDVEVPVEIVQEGVLRCQTPQHETGKVILCITSGNRRSCSEIREFEFRAKSISTSFVGASQQADATYSSEELLMLVRLVHLLLYGSDALSTLKGDVNTGIGHSTKSKATEDRWSQITEALLGGTEIPSGTVGWIVQELLKDKFQQWLSSKYHRNEGRDYILSRQEQGIIHLISGLGYEWALNQILNANVGVNFRDANGWTALHWAAHFGREEMIAALLAAGASATAVTDPTPQDPVGKTAGAISAARGYGGLAGYLSEADLTSHLSSLSVEENEIINQSHEVEIENAVESISQRSGQMHVGGPEEDLSLKDSLAAARNATQAAARIQAAFRAHSFRNRQLHSTEDDYGMTPEDIRGIYASAMFQRSSYGHRDQKFDKAALSIQKKYRGWKGRKDFLTLRRYVVKIQAHIRGHQERKKYKEFIWTVGVLEKVILRWRRGGLGLRGYRAEPEMINAGEEEEDVVKVFRKKNVNGAIDQAVSRVLSMVESPSSRQQYRRMLERYRQAEADLVPWDETTSKLLDDFEIIESSNFMS